MNTTDRILGEAMTPRQKRIYKDPDKAAAWAIKHQQRFPEAEPYIAKDPYWAYRYARDVLKGRWPEVEATIATSPHVCKYAKDVIKGRWPEGEEAIANQLPLSLRTSLSFYYARGVIKGRWPEAEAAIATDPGFAHLYARDVIGGRFPEGEEAIAKDPWAAHYYAKDVIRGRFPEGEKAIATDPIWSKWYLELYPEARLGWAMRGWIPLEDAWGI